MWKTVIWFVFHNIGMKQEAIDLIWFNWIPCKCLKNTLSGIKHMETIETKYALLWIPRKQYVSQSFAKKYLFIPEKGFFATVSCIENFIFSYAPALLFIFCVLPGAAININHKHKSGWLFCCPIFCNGKIYSTL